jgi:hypothetical protein
MQILTRARLHRSRCLAEKSQYLQESAPLTTFSPGTVEPNSVHIRDLGLDYFGR